MNFFYHGAVLGLGLDRVWVMRTNHFKKFLKVVFERPSLPLEVVFGSRYKPITGVVSFRPATAIAAHYGKVMQSALLPLLATLPLLLDPLTVPLVGTARPSLAVIPMLLRMKAAPATSSPEMCQVAMLSGSVVVIGYSQPSS
jgi:hypothetical protein